MATAHLVTRSQRPRASPHTQPHGAALCPPPCKRAPLRPLHACPLPLVPPPRSQFATRRSIARSATVGRAPLCVFLGRERPSPSVVPSRRLASTATRHLASVVSRRLASAATRAVGAATSRTAAATAALTRRVHIAAATSRPRHAAVNAHVVCENPIHRRVPVCTLRTLESPTPSGRPPAAAAAAAASIGNGGSRGSGGTRRWRHRETWQSGSRRPAGSATRRPAGAATRAAGVTTNRTTAASPTTAIRSCADRSGETSHASVASSTIKQPPAAVHVHVVCKHLLNRRVPVCTLGALELPAPASRRSSAAAAAAVAVAVATAAATAATAAAGNGIPATRRRPTDIRSIAATAGSSAPLLDTPAVPATAAVAAGAITWHVAVTAAATAVPAVVTVAIAPPRGAAVATRTTGGVIVAPAPAAGEPSHTTRCIIVPPPPATTVATHPATRVGRHHGCSASTSPPLARHVPPRRHR